MHIGQHHAEAQTMRDIDSVLGEGRDGMLWDPANQGAASELGVGDINGTLRELGSDDNLKSSN